MTVIQWFLLVLVSPVIATFRGQGLLILLKEDQSIYVYQIAVLFQKHLM